MEKILLSQSGLEGRLEIAVGDALSPQGERGKYIAGTEIFINLDLSQC